MAAEEVINVLEIRTSTNEEMVAAWTAENNISDDAREKLFKEGYTCLDAIKLIEMDDLIRTKIPRGQQKLIFASVQKLNRGQQVAENSKMPADAPAHSTQRSAQAVTPSDVPLASHDGEHQQQQHQQRQDPYLGALFTELQTGQSSTRRGLDNRLLTGTDTNGINVNSSINSAGQCLLQNSLSSNGPSSQSWRDPQIYLSAAAAGKSVPSCYDITDFVAGNVEEEIIVGGNGAQQVVLKTGPKKPKLENVTLAQWCVANNAILYKLIGESKLNASNILDYLSYTTKICQLVQRYSLVSVLLYDREYRRLQSEHNFRWGTDIPHLQSVHLQPRIARQVPTSKGGSFQSSRPTNTQAPLTLDGKTICKLFNSKSGCHFKECKYVHQCSVTNCHQQHSAMSHNHSKN